MQSLCPSCCLRKRKVYNAFSTLNWFAVSWCGERTGNLLVGVYWQIVFPAPTFSSVQLTTRTMRPHEATQRPELDGETNSQTLSNEDARPKYMKSEYGSSNAAKVPDPVPPISRNEAPPEHYPENQKRPVDLSNSFNNPDRRRKQSPLPTSLPKQTHNKMSVHNLISEDSSTDQIPSHSNSVIRKETPDASYHHDIYFENKTVERLYPLSSRVGMGMGNSLQAVPGSSNNSNLPARSEAGPPIFELMSTSARRQNRTGLIPRLSSGYVDMRDIHRGRQQFQGIREETPSGVDHTEISNSVLRSGNNHAGGHVGDFTFSQIRASKSQYQPLVPEPKAKRPWTEQEDSLLRSLVDQLGQGLWAAIAAQIPGRSGKQVRERWLNHLSPNVVKGPWTTEEDDIIIESHRRFGNCWSRIAKMLDGRSDNSVKNRYYTTLRRRISAPRTSEMRENQTITQEHLSSKKRRKSPTPQQPSEQVEIVNRRYKQARKWE